MACRAVARERDEQRVRILDQKSVKEKTAYQSSVNDPLRNYVYGAHRPISKWAQLEKFSLDGSTEPCCSHGDEDFFAAGPKDALERVWKCKRTREMIAKKLPRIHATMRKLVSEWGLSSNKEDVTACQQ